jgi:hypothetical protein
VSSDGDSTAELNRRVGQASQTFATLSQIWNHANISLQRKVQIFQACIETALMLGLHTACVKPAGRRRLDALQARCMRKLCRVQHSYLSHVTNQEVLNRCGVQPLSLRLLEQQLRLFGHVARKPDSSPVRNSVLTPNSIDLRNFDLPRRQGRPKDIWDHIVLREALRAAGSRDALEAMLENTAEARTAWRATVRRYVLTLSAW